VTVGFWSSLFNGLGTILGVLADTVVSVISGIHTGYENYRRRGGAVQEAAVEEANRNRDRLRGINDEIMDLRNRQMSRGTLSDRERRRWHELREGRDELLSELNQAKEVKATEKILATEELVEKVAVDAETTHILQYNAFADTLGKKCRVCGRQMKLQWRRNLEVASPRDFYWGCTGWYVQTGQGHACSHTEKLQPADFGLMTDTSAPEFSLTAGDFGEIVANDETAAVIATRVDDLRSDLSRRKEGVELATCPVHGERMVLRKKGSPSGLLDMYFLACPYWQHDGQGCSFIEKLKSGPQLAALLKSQTGRGIL
jgi:hypothetical protein